MGDQYDESGKNLSKIEKKMEKASYIVSEIKRSGSYEEVGEADDTEIRIMLLQTVVKPTLLYNTETWVNIRSDEWKKISSTHYEILRKTFEQKHSTPYWGIIAESGIWPYMYEVIYKRLMLFHHLIHSDEKRITRKMIINQMEKKEENYTWYAGVRCWLEEIRVRNDINEIKKMTKSEWKKKVKRGIEQKIDEEVKKKMSEMKKLRYVQRFEKKEYMRTCNMTKVKRIMKMRLNMVEVKKNFRGKYDDMMCLACREDEETTEHVIMCREYRRLVGHDIRDIQMNNLKWQIEASKVYEKIEETRKWLIGKANEQ